MHQTENKYPLEKERERERERQMGNKRKKGEMKEMWVLMLTLLQSCSSGLRLLLLDALNCNQ